MESSMFMIGLQELRFKKKWRNKAKKLIRNIKDNIVPAIWKTSVIVSFTTFKRSAVWQEGLKPHENPKVK